ncbi:hypothetical protein ACMBCN_01720 [Candidatus Liberibacter asiaticus]|nr:hypothetical protein [Candidatus Liberibacter asiaticus]
MHIYIYIYIYMYACMYVCICMSIIFYVQLLLFQKFYIFIHNVIHYFYDK